MCCKDANRAISFVFTQQDQLQSDNVLEDVACMLGCTRSSLHGTQPFSCWLLLSPLALGANSRRIALVQSLLRL